MNKIFFVLPYAVACSFMCASEQPLPKKIDNGPTRDGVRRKLSNPVARVQVDLQFADIMKNESRSPRTTYDNIKSPYANEINRNYWKKKWSDNLENK